MVNVGDKITISIDSLEEQAVFSVFEKSRGTGNARTLEGKIKELIKIDIESSVLSSNLYAEKRKLGLVK